MNSNITIYIKKRVVIFFHPFFIFLIVNLFSFNHSFASYSFNEKLEKAYSEFLALKINNGQKLIDQALREDPDNGIAIYLGNYADFIAVFASEEQILYDKLKKNETERLKKISKLSNTSPYYRFIQAEIKIQWAFVKLKFGDDINAFLSIRQAYKLLEENKKLFPDFIPTNKTLGLLNIMIGSLPQKYSSAVNLIGMSGDINKGIDQLNSVVNSNTIYQLESKIFKVLAENYILKRDGSDLFSVQSLYDSHKDNLLISFLYSSILLKSARCDESLQTLQSSPNSSEYINFPYMDFLTGEIFLFKGQYIPAKDFYLKFLNNYKGKNFIKDAYYKICLSYWLNNDEANAKLYLNKILKNGQTLYDTDKHAQKFAEEGELPNKILMKARLYSDGGYFQQALETINSFPIKENKNLKDEIEFYYRKGRIYHQLNNYSNASLLYLKTIELSENTNYYFAPNAALQMGYIYQEQKNKELARIYFQKALSYQNYEYKNSIDNKAKAALNEIKQKNQ